MVVALVGERIGVEAMEVYLLESEFGWLVLGS